MKEQIEKLKTLENKMKIEKLVIDSLKNEVLTDEYIDEYISVMKQVYDENINFIENIIKEVSKNDGK